MVNLDEPTYKEILNIIEQGRHNIEKAQIISVQNQYMVRRLKELAQEEVAVEELSRMFDLPTS